MTRVLPTSSFPLPLTSFIGRAREVTAACHLLRQPHVRLLTLTGPGGSGKTRLALQIAATLQDGPIAQPTDSSGPSEQGFTDGIYFIALDAVRDATLVLPTIAKSLSVHENWVVDV